MTPIHDEPAVSYETHDGQVFQRHPSGMLIYDGFASTRDGQRAWEKTLDWPTVGPKLIAALEDISWALSSDKPAAAQKIIHEVFGEIGRDKLDALDEDTSQG